MTNRAETTTLGVDLGDEELRFVLQTLGARTLPGVRFADLPDNELAPLLEAGLNSLRARGLAEVNTDDEGRPLITLSRTLGALVGAGLIAQQVVLLTYEQGPGIGEVTWIYGAPELIVVHGLISPGIHRFFIINSGDLFISTLAIALHLDTTQRRQSYQAFEIPSDFVAKMRANANKAYEMLTAAVNAPTETLVAFTKAVMSPESLSQVVLASQGEVRDQFRLLFSSESGYWGLSEKNSHLVCQPVEPLDITGRINNWIIEQRS